MTKRHLLFWSKIYFALGMILPIVLRGLGNKFLSFYDIFNWRFVVILLLYAVIALILGIRLKLKSIDENMTVPSFEAWGPKVNKNTPKLFSNALIGISVPYFIVALILFLIIMKNF